MFAFANVMHFFPHKFTSLGAGSFALPAIPAGPFKGLFLWHGIS
jgi:hypothetical protein